MGAARSQKPTRTERSARTTTADAAALSVRVGSEEDRGQLLLRNVARKRQPHRDGVRPGGGRGLKSSVLVKLQELSLGGEENAPVRRVRVSEFFNRPIQTQEELDDSLSSSCGMTSEVHRRRCDHHSGVNHAQPSPDFRRQHPASGPAAQGLSPAGARCAQHRGSVCCMRCVSW